MHTQNYNKKILVTGATGNVGTPLTKQLLAMEIPTRILVRNPQKVEYLDAKIERVVGDLDEPETLIKAMEEIESIFLITASNQQDINIINAAKKAGCRKIVKLSTQEAGWTPIKGHGHWHREREILIENSGLAWTFLRPTQLMSVALYWKYSIKAKNTVVYPGGAAQIASIHPDDVAAVAIAALTRKEFDGRGFELTGSESISMIEMTNTLSKVLGKPLKYVEQSDNDFIEDILRMKIPRYTAEGLVETFKYVRAGYFAHCTNYVQLMTGNKPRGFESWCKENAGAFG